MMINYVGWIKLKECLKEDFMKPPEQITRMIFCLYVLTMIVAGIWFSVMILDEVDKRQNSVDKSPLVRG